MLIVTPPRMLHSSRVELSSSLRPEWTSMIIFCGIPSISSSFTLMSAIVLLGPRTEMEMRCPVVEMTLNSNVIGTTHTWKEGKERAAQIVREKRADVSRAVMGVTRGILHPFPNSVADATGETRKYAEVKEKKKGTQTPTRDCTRTQQTTQQVRAKIALREEDSHWRV